MNGVLNINFEVFFYMVVGLFGLVGFFRGWWKEAVTTGLLVFLLIMLKYPALAATIIERINGIIDLIRKSDAIRAAGAIEPPATVDPSQSQFYIILLVVLVLASYFIGKIGMGDAAVTAGGRLFGGILGFVNGFIILSLFREYVLRRFLPDSGISAASVTPDNITMTITGVPQTSITDGLTIWILIIGGGLLFLATLSTRFKLTKGSISKQPPPGYKKG